MKPFQFVVASSAPDDEYEEYEEVPAYASIMVDEAFVSRLDVLRLVCFEHNLKSATVTAEFEWQETDIRIIREELHVESGSFWFEGCERYDGYDIETDVMSIANFVSLARAGEAEMQGGRAVIDNDKSYKWSNGILFYSGNADFVDDLISKFETAAETK